jgi:hypothetical protein
MEALAHGVVVGRAGRDALVTQSFGDEVSPEVAGHIFRTVVAENRSDPNPGTSMGAEHLVDEAHGLMVHRAEDDGHDGPAGEDVDGGELVHLADVLELADVKRVHADELARSAASQAEPEGLVFPAASVKIPVVAAAMAAARASRCDRFPRPWATRCFCTVGLAMEKPWSPRRSAYWRQPMVGTVRAMVNSASMTWVGVASGI